MGTEKEKYEPGNFKWTRFYEDVANALLNFKTKTKRKILVKKINKIAKDNELTSVVEIKGKKRLPLEDICPFSVMFLFNRTMTDKNRKKIAKQLADELGISTPRFKRFHGIPRYIPMNALFFDNKGKREDGDIDNLWKLFEVAIDYADTETDKARKKFIKAYDIVMHQRQIDWNITTGLYLIRPNKFLTLDGCSRTYLEANSIINVGKKLPDAEKYLELIEKTEVYFSQPRSFQELSDAANDMKLNNRYK